jgi:hypothetical protein
VKRLLAAVLMLAIVSGCSSEQPSDVMDGGPVTAPDVPGTSDGNAAVPRRVAVDISGSADTVSTWETVPEEAILYASPMVVVGRVVSIDGPFWNTGDGQRWEPGTGPMEGGEDYTVPTLYRQIAVEIVTTVRNDLDVATDSTVRFIALGAPTDEQPSPVGGTFRVGSEYLLFLSPEVLYMRVQPLPVLMPFHNWQGVYELDDQRVDLREDDTGAILLGDVVEMVETARNVSVAEWEPYRRSETDVASRIATALTALETGQLSMPGDGDQP